MAWCISTGTTLSFMNWVRSASKMTGCELGELGLISSRGRDFLFIPASRPALELIQPEHEAVHSSQSTAKVKNVFFFTSTPWCVFMAWCVSSGTILPLPNICS